MSQLADVTKDIIGTTIRAQMPINIAAQLYANILDSIGYDDVVEDEEGEFRNEIKRAYDNWGEYDFRYFEIDKTDFDKWFYQDRQH